MAGDREPHPSSFQGPSPLTLPLPGFTAFAETGLGDDDGSGLESGLGRQASGLGHCAAMSRDPWKLKVFGQADELILQVCRAT